MWTDLDKGFLARRLARYLVLPFLLGLGFAACFAGWFVGLISRHPEAFLGGRPAGAVKVVRIFANSVRWLAGKAKEYLLQYLRSHHWLVYRKLKRLLKP